MKDISNQLIEVMKANKCSSLLAFMMVENNGIYIQQSKSDEENSGRLCDKSDSDTN